MSKKLTRDEVAARIMEIHGDNLCLQGEYKGRLTLTVFVDKEYGEWLTLPDSVLSGCQHPLRIKSEKSLSLQQVVDKIKNTHGDAVKMIGEFKGVNVKTLFRHKEYGEWEATPRSVYRGSSYPITHYEKNKTTLEAMLLKISEKYGDSVILAGEFKGMKVKTEFLCKTYGQWIVSPSGALRAKGHPNTPQEKTFTANDVEEKIKEMHAESIKMIGEFKGMNVKTLFRHREYGEWAAAPRSIIYKKVSHPSLSVQRRRQTNLEKYGKYIVNKGNHWSPEWLPVKRIIQLTGYSESHIYKMTRTWDCTLEETFWLLMTSYKPTGTTLERDASALIGFDFYNRKFLGYRPDFKLSESVFMNVDGGYYHSEEKKDKQYHYDMRRKYEKHGCKILQFTDAEIYKKPDIVKSMVNARINKNTTKIHARATVFSPISSGQAKVFLERNHLKGNSNARAFALMDSENNIHAVMTVSISKNTLKIQRFCNKLNTVVVGGYSKLLSNIIKLYSNIKAVETWIDLRYGTGNHLKSLGFSQERETLGFYWSDCKNNYNRLYCKAGGGRSERQNAEQMGLMKIWDAGQRKFTKVFIELCR